MQEPINPMARIIQFLRLEIFFTYHYLEDGPDGDGWYWNVDGNLVGAFNTSAECRAQAVQAGFTDKDTT